MSTLFAIIDIGSNSTRLVIYDGATRAPVEIVNEKVSPRLGFNLGITGVLNPDGIEEVIGAVGRYNTLCQSLGVRKIHTVATAAVRRARDQNDFVARIKKECGLIVDVISGEEEGRLSALGVLSGIPDAQGLIGDLGGGSLELALIDRGKVGERATLPLGPYELMVHKNYRSERSDISAKIQSGLDDHPWIVQARDQNFYAVGGSWRAIATAHMEDTGYPLRVIHNYAVPAREGREFADGLSSATLLSLQRLKIGEKRRPLVPYAALVLERILKASGVDSLVFSGYGLRDGIFFDQLSPQQQKQDPLLAACRNLMKRASGAEKAEELTEALIAWTAPLFANETPTQRRLREAVILLSNLCLEEHPDHRARIACEQVLDLQMGGIDHPGRAFLGLASYARHGGLFSKNKAQTKQVEDMIARLLPDPAARERARALGSVLNFAFELTAGIPALLTQTRLQERGGGLVLTLDPSIARLASEAIEGRFSRLAESRGVQPVIKKERLQAAPAAARSTPTYMGAK